MGLVASARMDALDVVVKKLRPRKLRQALRRRWFEWRMLQVPVAPISGLASLGTEYGYYIVPAGEIDEDWVCYCVGTGADISFELALIELGATRVRSFEAVANLVDYVREQAKGHESLSVEQAALALEDGPLRMQVSHVPVSQSVSAAALYEGDNYVEVPGRTLTSLMEEKGDDRIDLLKFDVEGLEYDLLPTLDLRALGVRVLCTQFHHTGSVREAKALISDLREKGYELIACYDVVKLTFVARELLDDSGR